MGSTGHLSVQKGKRVIVHMRDHGKAIGKFVERRGNYVVIDIGGTENAEIPTQNIRTISIYKPNGGQNHGE